MLDGERADGKFEIDETEKKVCVKRENVMIRDGNDLPPQGARKFKGGSKHMTFIALRCLSNGFRNALYHLYLYLHRIHNTLYYFKFFNTTRHDIDSDSS